MSQEPSPDRSNGNLDERLDQIARTANVLIASDYDGTLAPIVADPKEAAPLRESMVALRMLADMPGTHVAVISGRSLSDLAELTRLPTSVHLVGSHGSEFDAGFAKGLTDEQRALLKSVHEDLAEVAKEAPGFMLETKPSAVAFHYRGAEPEAAERAVQRITAGPAARPGVFTKRGKMVVELSVVGMNKGDALSLVRQRVGAGAVIFIGDDVTDEDAFGILKGPDVGVKVGDGETAARCRVEDPHEVAQCLARIAEVRASWVLGGDLVPIEEHSMLSDMRTCALVTPSARITYLCMPRIDSPAIFCELLGGPGAGQYAIEPVDGAEPVSQRYVGDSLVLRTEFPTFTITDYLDCTGGRPFHRAGRSDLVRVVEGTGRVRVRFAPRLDFGRMPTQLKSRDGGLEIEGAPDSIVLRSPELDWTITREGSHETAEAEVDLGEEPLVLSLRYGVSTTRASLRNAVERGEMTADFWSRWAERLRLPSVHPEAVKRSALTLRGLVYGPTGAIAAAATTSLPEDIGGVRNWDYRYCWPRDASIAAKALSRLGCDSEGMALLDWLLGVVEKAESPDRIHPLYTVAGEEISLEGEIGELSGYAGSRPVRVGNAAANQVQLDVFGPIVDLIHWLAMRDAPLSSHHFRLVEAMVHAVESRWAEPDHGIWEIRKPKQHHVHSKIMCWLTVDRAIHISRLLRQQEPRSWIELRDEIAGDVLERGWCTNLGCFGAAYDCDDVDAATLLIGLTGLLDAKDERFLKTVDTVETHLRKGDGLYRYRYDDGLPGFEGAFNLCTGWLILCYIELGRLEEARRLFDAFVGLCGPTGLMSEEYGVNSNRSLGNFPQAYSHAALIECAVALDRAENGADPESTPSVLAGRGR